MNKSTHLRVEKDVEHKEQDSLDTVTDDEEVLKHDSLLVDGE